MDWLTATFFSILAAGFFVLMFSNFVPTTHLGLLSGIVMLIAMVCELVLTPLLMHSTRLVTLWNVLLVRMDPLLVKTAPLLHGLSRWEARKLVLLGGLRALRPGELLIRAGDSGNELYMVVSGRVRVFALDPQGRERTLTVLGPSAVLGEVAMVGNDMALDAGIGTCGKQGQGVPVGVGQPTLKLSGLTVGGTAV